ncbi:MAG: hypothetical protein ACREM2_02410 [Vulcanimicrobiaceae bacterium]
MSIYRVIDKLETYVREGTWLPLGYRILSEQRMLEFVEKMRSTLPEEVGRAKVIATNKDRMIRDAQERAQAIVSEAVTQKNELVEGADVVRQARATAEIVLREAEEKARRVREGADTYANSLLADLEVRLGTALGSVKKGQEALAGRAAAKDGARSLADDAADAKRAAFDVEAAQAHVSEHAGPLEIAT